MRVLLVALVVGAGPCLGQSLWETMQSGLERLEHEGRKDFGRLGSWMQPHIERLGEQVGHVGDSVGPALSSLGERVGEVGDSVGPALTSLGEQVRGLGEQVGPAIHSMGQQVVPALSNLGEQVKPAIDNLGEQVVPVIRGVGEQVAPVIKGMGEHMGGLVDGLVDTVKESPMFREKLDRSDDMLIIRGEGQLSAPPSGGPGLLGQIGDLAGQIGSQIGRLNPLGGRRSGEWWEGSGVCTEREVLSQEPRTERVNVNGRGFGVLTMSMGESVCSEAANKYECRTAVEEGGVKKTIVVRYGCCHGYQRKPDEDSCSKVTMKSLEDTVREQGGAEFLNLMEETGLLARLQDNLTVFVPSASAVEDFHRSIMEFNTLELGSTGGHEVIYNIDEGLSYDYRKKREIVVAEGPSLEDSVLAHVAPGFVSVQQMQEQGLLATEGSGNIRTTVYRTKSEKVIMANCARVTARDILATNGVVHMVDKMIQPASHTLGQILSSDLGFRDFSKALKAAGLLPMLEDTSGHFTVFAPTDEAMKKLNRKTLNHLSAGAGCAGTILKGHILPNIVCSGVIEGQARTNNMLGELMLLERTSKDTVSVDGVELVMRDIMATNGVIHVIDDVIIPSAAKSLSDVLTMRKMTTLRDMLDSAKLLEEVDSLTNKTIFLPSTAAMAELPASFIAELVAEPANLLEFVLLHTAAPLTRRAALTDGLVLASEVRNQAIRINHFTRTSNLFGETRATVTAQCSKVQGPEVEVCGGVVHTIDRVLLPTPSTVLELARSKQEYSRFLEIAEFSGIAGELETEAAEGRTLLAPTNAAFAKLSSEITEKLLTDKAFAQKVVQKHILEDVLCCSGIQKNNIFFNSSRRRAGVGQVSVRRTASGHLYADKAEISKCDMMAGNGVVLQLESVLV